MSRSIQRDAIHDGPIADLARVAEEAVASGDERALDFLDRRLRRTLLTWVRGADFQIDDLLDAIQGALQVARAQGQRAWLPRWKYLLEVAAQARDTAAVDAQVGVLERCTPMQRAVLEALDRGDALTNGALSERIGRSPSQVSNLTSALAREGLVSRIRLGRESYASLTARGRRLMAAQGTRSVEPTSATRSSPPSVDYWGGFRPADVTAPP